MAKKKEHEHTFKRSGMTLWCKCGMTQRIECAHKWELKKREGVRFDKMGGQVHQTQEIYERTRCGAVRHTNVTTAETTITH